MCLAQIAEKGSRNGMPRQDEALSFAEKHGLACIEASLSVLVVGH